MRRSQIIPLIFWVGLCVVSSRSLWSEPVWQIGTFQAVEKKVESTPRTYLWDVVVTSTDVITYRLQIRTADQTYVADYTPEIQPSDLPAGWQLGQALKLRVEKKQMIIKTSYGEITTYITDPK
jgi:hypothetical protein